MSHVQVATLKAWNIQVNPSEGSYTSLGGAVGFGDKSDGFACAGVGFLRYIATGLAEALSDKHKAYTIDTTNGEAAMANSVQSHLLSPFLDMDGVLANFEKGCQNLMGPQFAYKHLPKHQFEVYRNELFNRIEATPTFWEDLEPMPDALELYEGVLKLGIEPHILTAVPRHLTLTDPRAVDVAAQKQRWIEKYLGARQAQSFTATLGHLKQEHQRAGRLNILIDDLASNIHRWNRGPYWAHGILHTSAKNSLDSLTWWLNNA